MRRREALATMVGVSVAGVAAGAAVSEGEPEAAAAMDCGPACVLCAHYRSRGRIVRGTPLRHVCAHPELTESDLVRGRTVAIDAYDAREVCAGQLFERRKHV